MANGDPKEYLTLVNTGGSDNFSSYAGAHFGFPDVVTHFTKVRLDPATLRVDIDDLTFSQSTGGGFNHGGIVTSMPYASAMDCDNFGSQNGLANVNLAGTPFSVNDAFSVEGHFPGGNSTFSVGNQVVNLSGGGFCGWNWPLGLNPWPHPAARTPVGSAADANDEFDPDFRLDLAFVGPSVAAAAGSKVIDDGNGGLAYVLPVSSCNTAPDALGAVANPGSLWPPNKKMVAIAIDGIIDAEGDAVTITIDAITNDETGTDDASGVGTSTASVRAARFGKGDGRVYTIEFTATDAQGASTTGSVTVAVPHDQGDDDGDKSDEKSDEKSKKSKSKGSSKPAAAAVELRSWGQIKAGN